MIKVLDCTLRDGGYMNHWAYGADVARGIISGVAAAGVEYIEIGFLCNEKREESTTIYTSVAEAERLLPPVCAAEMILLMIEFGHYDISRVPERAEGGVDAIRLIFKKNEIQDALEYAAQLKRKGYRVFVNPISVTSYSDEEMLELVDKVNRLRPYAFSIVDTYGLMHQESSLHYFHLLDEHLHAEITIGAHFHNNFQMAYANCVALARAPRKHDLILDASCYGMGKRAGNACTELLCHYLNEHAGKHYDMATLLELIESYMLEIHRATPWGYNVHYYLAAHAKVHPNYVSFMENRRGLPIRAQMDILSRIPEAYRLTYSEELIRELCAEYSATESHE